MCPVCDEKIIDVATKSQKVQDSIFCDGDCLSWLHRRCGELSKKRFLSMSKSQDPFCCPLCWLSNMEGKVADLMKEIQLLKAGNADTPSRDQTRSYASVASIKLPHQESAEDPGPEIGVQDTTPSDLHDTPSDRKFNVVVFGVDECVQGTARYACLNEDLGKVVSVLQKVHGDVKQDYIKDLIRLGK